VPGEGNQERTPRRWAGRAWRRSCPEALRTEPSWLVLIAPRALTQWAITDYTRICGNAATPHSLTREPLRREQKRPCLAPAHGSYPRSTAFSGSTGQRNAGGLRLSHRGDCCGPCPNKKRPRSGAERNAAAVVPVVWPGAGLTKTGNRYGKVDDRQVWAERVTRNGRDSLLSPPIEGRGVGQPIRSVQPFAASRVAHGTAQSDSASWGANDRTGAPMRDNQCKSASHFTLATALGRES
jgi:hypothetical protein